MKCLAQLAIFVLSASLTSPIPLAAQSFGVAGTEDQSGRIQSTLSVQPPAAGCPISMHASQLGGGTTIMVDSKGQKHPVSRGLHLSLIDPLHTAAIVSAEVTVHGLNGKPHSVQSGPVSGNPVFSGSPFRPDGFWDSRSGGDRPWEMTRNLTVRFGSGRSAAGKVRSAETELSIAGFTSVTWISLDSLTLSDGTVWTPLSRLACRTAPDPFLLVSATQAEPAPQKRQADKK